MVLNFLSFAANYKLQTANLKLKKALSLWDSAFFL